MNEIVLNNRELARVSELFQKLNQNGDYGLVTLKSESESGIGHVLTATFSIEHEEIEGNFTVVITDERDW